MAARSAVSCGARVARASGRAGRRRVVIGAGPAGRPRAGRPRRRRREPLVDEPDQVAIGARAGMHRHDPEPTSSLTTMTGPGRATMAARAAATGPSSSGSIGRGSSPRIALSQSVRPSMRTGSSGCRRRHGAPRGRPRPRPSSRSPGGRARWRAIRSSSSGSPGQAVARNQARRPGEPLGGGRPNRLLPLRVPPSARIRGGPSAPPRPRRIATQGRRDDASRDRQLDAAPKPSPSRPRAATIDATGEQPDDGADRGPDRSRGPA